MQWSDQQQEIFKWFKSGKGNLTVLARAGTGKTTTIIQAITGAPERKILLCAFNKKIADELKTKLRHPGAEARTLHSLGYTMTARVWNSIRLDERRGARLAEKAAGESTPSPMLKLITKLASVGKSFMAENATELENLAYRFDLVPDEEWIESDWDAVRVSHYAMKAMDLSIVKDGTLDYDDMIYVPVRAKFARQLYDLVVVDEAQDMNAAQLKLATMVNKRPGGRLVVVGDDRQSIYGFRGADSNAINRMTEELKSEVLKLTVTYRCPQKIVDYAKGLVPDYVAAPSAPTGEIAIAQLRDLPSLVQPGDFVLSRKNAPLAKTCMAIVKAGKRAKVEGKKDIGQVLIALITKLSKNANDLPELLQEVNVWKEKVLSKVDKLGDDAKIEAKIQEVTDTVDTINVFAEDLTSIAELKARIDDFFVDDVSGSVVVCSSVHKAKGRETDNVFILEWTLYPGKAGRKNVEEQNIEYVAVTRAKKKLTWVKDTP